MKFDVDYVLFLNRVFFSFLLPLPREKKSASDHGEPDVASLSMRRACTLRQWNLIRANTDFLEAQKKAREEDSALWRQFYRDHVALCLGQRETCVRLYDRQ